MTCSTISLAQARALVDMAGRPDAGRLSRSLTDSQLEGAVAAHNLLCTRGICYVADEVGTGKTLVAAGALALLRHADPNLRALVIAPKSNLQTKWGRELSAFARHNVLFADLRVVGADRSPLHRPQAVGRLSELISLWQADSSIDVIARLSSFQLSHSEIDSGAARYVETWRALLTGGDSRGHVARVLDRAAKAPLRERKQMLAACMNRLLPQIGLLIFDEAHNLKGGNGDDGADRNRVLWTFLGHNPAYEGVVPGYGPKVDRVLMLSATPLEDHTDQLRRQLGVLGVEGLVPELDPALHSEDQRLDSLRTFLFRRPNKLRVAGVDLTRNRYREEWRRGGTMTSSEPLELADDRARLMMALVQKKVADAINAGGNKHFQIGMLTSFESLAESVDSHKPSLPLPHNDEVEQPYEQPDYDDAAQNRQASEIERRGIDTVGIRDLVASHKSEFNGETPRHPKLDAVVARLVASARAGRKTLVFTRRVASVDELVQGVNDCLDLDLRSRLQAELQVPDGQVGELFARYTKARQSVSTGLENATDIELEDDPDAPRDVTATLKGGDSFFSWLVRNEDKTDMMTIKSLRGRFERSGVYATVLKDNYVAALLGCRAEETASHLADLLQLPDEDVRALVDERAQQYLGESVNPSYRFEAAQWSALTLIEEHGPEDSAERASVAMAVLRPPELKVRLQGRISVFDDLGVPTLASALRDDPGLLEALWQKDVAWVWTSEEDMRRREWSWRLLSAAVRLDYPAVDMWACEVARVGSLKAEDHAFDREHLIADFLNLMREQRTSPGSGWSSYKALTDLAENVALVLECNGVTPEHTEMPQWAGSRMPAVGLSQQVNKTSLAQFRTPTYPLVLVSTDLVQEGEDLHTFCDEVHHYGIAWMPSSLEQRTGRIDRVNSLVERRLTRAGATLDDDGKPPPGERLQVLYPYVSSTYEEVQVRHVFDRLDDHIRLLHDSFGKHSKPSPKIDVSNLSNVKALSLPAENLGEPYKINKRWLKGTAPKFPLVTRKDAADVLRRFADIVADFRELASHPIVWRTRTPTTHILGEIALGGRVQPLDLRLASTHGFPMVRIVSPVGLLDTDATERLVSMPSEAGSPRIGILASAHRTFSMTVEDVVPFGVAGPAGRDLLAARMLAVLSKADELERTLLGLDNPLDHFVADLNEEVGAGG